jgi:hypothetical protein
MRSKEMTFKIYFKKDRHRGTGTIIAAAFLILIVLSGYTLTAFLNKKTQELNEALNEVYLFDWERGNEKIIIFGNPFSTDNGLNISVQNVGEVDVFLRWITVRNATNLKPISGMDAYSSINIKLRPGEIATGIGENIMHECNFTEGYKGTKKYVIQVLTSRGTITSYQYPPLAKEYRQVYNKIISGPFEFDQEKVTFSFTSQDIDGDTTSWDNVYEKCYTDNPLIPQKAYNMCDCYDNIVYHVTLKNVENRTVEIHSSSFLLIVVPLVGATGETELYNYIVSNSSDSTNLESYNGYKEMIPPGGDRTLKFGCTQQEGNEFLPTNSLRGYQGNNPGTENLATTYLILFWKFSGTNETYGQTTPLAAIHIDKYDCSYSYYHGYWFCNQDC